MTKISTMTMVDMTCNDKNINKMTYIVRRLQGNGMPRINPNSVENLGNGVGVINLATGYPIVRVKDAPQDVGQIVKKYKG